MAPSPDASTVAEPAGFRLALSNFEGPFDLLLSLISKQELDITEIALSAVTDEFLSYLHGIDTIEGLDQASEFLVVAATLLDLKIAGLLPQGELVDAEDAALLEARDLLFARLLQYRAFKQVSAWFGERIAVETSRHVRSVPLEPELRTVTPELLWTISAADFAALASVALAPKLVPTVGLEHLHAPAISVREQAAHIVALLRSVPSATFGELVADAIAEKGIVVARFIAVLELYRHAAIAFDQPEPLGELTLRWVAELWSDGQLAALGADYER
ncbi:segregation/condensation protein A [Microbacteriaceae bacterium VKM Ac-2854]|nr:segregation/condensation protein A [Microbacteriaceae bacterium VKM Ac-2854]